MKSLKLSLICSILMVFAAPGFASPFQDIKFQNGEETIINNFMGNGEVAKTVNTIQDKGSTYLLSILEENGDVTKISLAKESMIPLFHKKVSRDGKLKKFVEYESNGEIIISIPDKKIKKILKAKEQGYDMASLFYLLRCFPFKSAEKITFDIVMHDPDNVRAVKMYIKYLGEEDVKVKAGKFHCYKLEMGCEKMIENLVWPYKYYFWFTSDAPHHFVKYQGRETDLSILTNELESYRAGKKIYCTRP